MAAQRLLVLTTTVLPEHNEGETSIDVSIQQSQSSKRQSCQLAKTQDANRSGKSRSMHGLMHAQRVRAHWSALPMCTQPE